MGHEQVTIDVEGEPIEVDVQLADVIGLLNNKENLITRASCQNYGEYLREFGDLDHMLYASTDYAYIEFNTVDEALDFFEIIHTSLVHTDPLIFRLSHQGTPGAWEVRYVIEWGVWWVMFPQEDIPRIGELLRDH